MVLDSRGGGGRLPARTQSCLVPMVVRGVAVLLRLHGQSCQIERLLDDSIVIVVCQLWRGCKGKKPSQLPEPGHMGFQLDFLFPELAIKRLAIGASLVN